MRQKLTIDQENDWGLRHLTSAIMDKILNVTFAC